MRTHTSRRPGAAPLALLGALLLALLLPLPAHAAGGYRYWGFFNQADGAWAFAQKGPAELTPKDGSVDGWRYQLSETVAPSPRAVLSFDDICAETPAEDGKKRVGLVIDYGRPVDAADPATTPPAPVAHCVVADPDATSAEILADSIQVREEKGMTCAINNYPASGCGDPVHPVPAEAKAKDEPVDIAIRPVGDDPTVPATIVQTPVAPATTAIGTPTLGETVPNATDEAPGETTPAQTTATEATPAPTSTATSATDTEDDEDSFPWVWLLAGLALLALIGAGLGMARRKAPEAHGSTAVTPRDTTVRDTTVRDETVRSETVRDETIVSDEHLDGDDRPGTHR